MLRRKMKTDFKGEKNQWKNIILLEDFETKFIITDCNWTPVNDHPEGILKTPFNSGPIEIITKVLKTWFTKIIKIITPIHLY